jgi:2-polyprenyl-6-methoxyphenol hydroxylase-like FAD-dependent oxidoreductase
MRIACVGGGPAGLYFALLMKLRDPGHHITVFERNAADSAQGWGVTFGPDLLDELQRNDPESAQGIRQAAFNQLDQVVEIHGERVVEPGAGVYGIRRHRLLDILTDRARSLGVHVEFDHEVMTPSQLPEAHLIVACDGVNSRMRLAAGGFQTDVHLGGSKYLWLGTSKVFESFTYAFVRTDSGWVWAYAYGIGVGQSTFIVECSSQTWSGLGFDALSPEDSLRVLEKHFEHLLDGHPLLGQVQRDAGAGWLNFRTVTNQRWCDGNIVLAGDAAHTTDFTIGSGTTMAIEDAIALADNLQWHPGDPRVALESYERQRKAAIMLAQSDARLSARWFEDISRYTGLQPREFAALLHGRRSPVLPHLPPRVYYRLYRVVEEVTVLDGLRRRLGPRVKAIYSQRHPAQPGTGPTIREHAKR